MTSKRWTNFCDARLQIWKESSHIDSQQFHQYQQNKQPASHFRLLNTKKTMT